MKRKNYQIKILESPKNTKMLFEDLPNQAQEALIDLIVSIIKNKRKEIGTNKEEGLDNCKGIKC